MNTELFECLNEERSIFRDFNSFTDIGDYQVFHSPDLNEIPHWNLAYPKSLTKKNPSQDEINKISQHFQSKNLIGHVLMTDRSLYSDYSEESEYFVINRAPSVPADSKVNLMTHLDSELDQFSSLMQKCFSLTDQTTAYFKKKMAMLKSRVGTKFYIIKFNDNVVGGCSVFSAENGSSFMFNVGTLQSMQGSGIAQEILAYAVVNSSRPLYTYSHNPLMRESILPKLGFRSIGTIWCVPISQLL